MDFMLTYLDVCTGEQLRHDIDIHLVGQANQPGKWTIF
jgi:hypothetical protein